MQKRGKRGLSTVIVTLILILVSLVAVGIIWVVVRNIIQTGTEGVGLSQFSLNAKILDVSIDNSSNNISLTVKRNAGKGELDGISFVFSSDGNNEVITRTVSLKELEQMKFNFHLINVSVSDLISVSIVPLIKQDGKQISGIALDKYNLGNSKNTLPSQTACSPTNCSILGYVCGIWNNGTCAGTFNCGTCTGGQTCNSSGRCVASCVPATCASLGYQCGTGYANGTCSGNLDCGTCTGGQTCNASGRCVASLLGEHIYISQNFRGLNNGADCLNAHSIAWFNTASNWNSVVNIIDGRIGPGDIVHLCDIISSALTIQSNGTSTNKITILFENNAKISMPACPGRGYGCINANYKKFLIIDGGQNGIIENTQSGTGMLTGGSYGINAWSCDNCEFKNIHIQNIYLRTNNNDLSVDQTMVRCITFSGSNISIHDNVMHDTGWCIVDEYNGNDNNVRIYNNDIYNIDHGFVLASTGLYASGFYFYNNHVHDYANWDSPTNTYHHDGIHAFGFPGVSNPTNFYIYNNIFDGDVGGNPTAHIFLEGGSSPGSTPWTINGTVYIYNNVFIANRLIYGIVQNSLGKSYIYNNVIQGFSASEGICLSLRGDEGYVKNNIIGGCNQLVSAPAAPYFSSSASFDYNMYTNCAGSYNCWWIGSVDTGNFNSYKSATGFDAHSIALFNFSNNFYSGVNLSNGKLFAGSPAINNGTSLSSFFATDIIGVSRPQGSAWDIGAYEYNGTFLGNYVNALSCSYTDVSSAINSASTGNIVVVPAGSCTWNSPLIITKGITLQGAGIGQTIITNGIVSGGYLLKYEPSDYPANNAFRLNGFEFNANDRRILELGSGKSAPFVLQTKVRIDHNKFTNSGTTGAKGQAIWNYGSLYGVVDNNLFERIGYPIAHSYGVNEAYGWWANSPQNIFQHGSANYMYFEDNTFNLVAYGGADNILTDGEYAARYVFRYNTITNVVPSYSLFEIHGQAGDPMPACFGVELYGNQIIHGSNAMTFWKQRSGQSLVFLNNAVGTTSPDSTAYTSTLCTCPVNYASLKVTHNSYWWGSRRNLNGAFFGASATGGLNCNGLTNIPTLGRDIFSDASTPGVSSGTLANLPVTCTVGQGYWATSQSTIDLTGMVGKNPTTPISGTLYRCTSTNTWTAYYTPYTYPHPLTLIP